MWASLRCKGKWSCTGLTLKNKSWAGEKKYDRSYFFVLCAFLSIINYDCFTSLLYGPHQWQHMHIKMKIPVSNMLSFLNKSVTKMFYIVVAVCGSAVVSRPTPISRPLFKGLDLFSESKAFLLGLVLVLDRADSGFSIKPGRSQASTESTWHCLTIIWNFAKAVVLFLIVLIIECHLS